MYEAIAIVNSRPITPFIDRETGAQTLYHLPHMKSGIVMPPLGQFDSNDVYSRKRWRGVQGSEESFWFSWRTHYFSNLQRRAIWQE